MKNVYGYARVSTAKQGNGVSLEMQRESIEAYAKRHQLDIVDWFIEKETAAKQGRPIFTKMVSLLQQGKATGVIMHKIDRSARNLKDWAAIGELMDSGVEVHFSFEAIDCDTRGGRLSADIQAVIAADYIRNLRSETIKGFYGRLKQGIWPLPAPLGYLDMGSGKPKKLDPVRSRLIRKMFELYDTGTYSVRSLTTKMNDLGLRNRGGKKITKITISTTLRNPYYYGVMKVKKTGELFLGKHKPLITKGLFDSVQDKLDGKTSRMKKKHRFILSRSIKCYQCDYSLVAEKQKGIVYYRCQRKGCPTQTIREDVLIESFRRLLKAVSLPKDLVAEVTNRCGELVDNSSVEEEIKSLNVTLANAKKREAALTDALLDGLIEKADFQSKKAEINVRVVELERQILRLESSEKQTCKAIQEFLELQKSLAGVCEKAKSEEICDLVKKISSNLFLDVKKLVIEPASAYADTLNFQSVLFSCQTRTRT